MQLLFVYTAEDNVLTATSGDIVYTLTLTDKGTFSDEELAAWGDAGCPVPEIIFDAAENTASVTVEGATATVKLAEGTLKEHSVKVICGADSNGNSYITNVLAGTDVTVTAGTYEGKLFEKWISDLSINGSTDEAVTFRMPNEDVTVEAEFVDCYPLSVFDGTTLTSEPQKVNYTATVNVPSAPNGMRFKNWTAEGITLTDFTASVLEFSMPANAVMLTANYIASHTVTVEGGTITNAGTSAQAFAGDTISITADADTNDTRFTEWGCEADITFADKTAKTTTFTMPDADVNISAKTGRSYTVTVFDGTASGLNDAGKAFAGQTVTVTANTISGHKFTGWTGDGVIFADASSTVTSFTMPANSVTVKANHEQIKVTPPTAGTKTYTYNGTAQTYEFASNGDVSYYSLKNNRQTDAGTYTVKAHLIDGAVWTDGTSADKEYTFVIARQSINKPIAYNTKYYYNGAEQSFILCSQIGGSYYYYESTVPAGSVTYRGKTRTDAGSQSVMVTPTSNYCWADGTRDSVIFGFTINKYPVPVLFSDPHSFTFNGKPQKYTPFVSKNGNLYDFDGLYYDLANRTQTLVGNYTVTATLKNNFCWEDGSTAQRNFNFQIKEDKLDTYIYYLNDLDAGGALAWEADISYTEFDNISELKAFSKHPEFEEDMLKDHYMPRLENVPVGATATFYIKEDMVTPRTISEVNKCTRWEDVKMSDLKPDTIYYMFAVVTCPGYDYQITEIDGWSCFITTDPMFKLEIVQMVTETELNEEYQMNVINCIFEGGINNILNTFSTKKITKTTAVQVKVEHFVDFDEAILQAISDIDEGLQYAAVSWTQNGKYMFFDMTAENVGNYKSLYNTKSALRSAPKKMLAASAEDPAAPVLITGISDEPAELTPELLNAMFGSEQVESILLDSEEFKVEKDLELALAQTKEKNEAALERFEANGLIPEEGTPDYYFSTVTINSLLHDPATGLVDGESYEYKLATGEKLPAGAVKEIAGYTFDGFYYKNIFEFEKENKSAEATGDQGMILTQGLVKWNPETDIVTRDLDLMAIYIKDGAQEPVGYLTSGTTFLDEGSEAIITLPALAEGMTYGDVTNGNANITVSAINDGKVTVTLNNDVTGDETFAFTVGVNSNIEGIEDPIYYIIVTVNAVEEAVVKEEAEAAIEAIATEGDSDEVTAIIEKALEDVEKATSVDAVEAIVAETAKAVANQKAAEVLAAAKEEAKAALAEDKKNAKSDEAKAAIDEAIEAINNATNPADVAEAKADAEAAATDADKALADAKAAAIEAVEALAGEDATDEVKQLVENAKKAINSATNLDAVDTAKDNSLATVEHKQKEEGFTVPDLDIQLGYRETAPVNAESTTNKIIYTSSDENVVTVDENGNLVSHKKGTATVTATLKGTDISEEIKVTVSYTVWDIIVWIFNQIISKISSGFKWLFGIIGINL